MRLLRTDPPKPTSALPQKAANPQAYTAQQPAGRFRRFHDQGPRADRAEILPAPVELMEEIRQLAWYSRAKPPHVYTKWSRERRAVNQREGAVIAHSAGWVIRLQQEKTKVAVRHPIEQTTEKCGVKLNVEFLVRQKTQVDPTFFGSLFNG